MSRNDQLRALIEASILERHDLWFPGLANALTEDFERNGLNLDNYGTVRWLHSIDSRPRNEVASIVISGRSSVVEALSHIDQKLFPSLTFRSPASTDLQELESAAELFRELPTLAQSVSCLVRSIHVLASEPEYDVSHSDPNLPFSIFVSVPSAQPFATLRLLESIVHEAMHLQLSLMESIVPMTKGEFFAHSPWQGRSRPAQGLLHGLYVFSVISQAMRVLSRNDPTIAVAAKKRIDQIRTEIHGLDGFEAGLSPLGRALNLRARSAALGS